jgi:hypothetical protein
LVSHHPARQQQPAKPGRHEETAMEPIEQLSHILPKVSDLVDRISPGQLDDATPCDEFQVRDVLDHMITLGGGFAYL